MVDDQELIDLPNDSGTPIDPTSSIVIQKNPADTRRRTPNDFLSSPNFIDTYILSDEDSPLSLGIIHTTIVASKQITLKNVIVSLGKSPTGSPVILDFRKETGYNTGVFNSIFSTIPQVNVGELDSTHSVPAVLSDATWEKDRRMQIVLTGVDSGNTAAGLKSILAIDSVFGISKNWFDFNFKRRKKFTVNVGEVPSVQNNFPATIKVTNTELQGYTLDQFRFTDESGNLLDHYFSEYDASPGFVNVRFKKPTIQDGDIVYMYYDNPTAVDTSNSPNVFDANYKAFYDMYDVGLEILDRTGNLQHLTHNNYLSNDTGPTGRSRVYDGTINTYDIRNPFNGFPSDTISVEYRIKTNSSGEGMISYAIGTATLANHFLAISQEDIEVFLSGIVTDTNINIADNIFHQVVIEYNSVTGDLKIIVDGSVLFSTVIATGETFNDGGSLMLGQDQDGVGINLGQSLNGEIDKVSISNITRSIDWWKTIDNNERIGSTFWNEGAEEITP